MCARNAAISICCLCMLLPRPLMLQPVCRDCCQNCLISFSHAMLENGMLIAIAQANADTPEQIMQFQARPKLFRHFLCRLSCRVRAHTLFWSS